jgi:pyridoxal/pyridoxine/pyridoxamine kinase
MNKSMNKFVVFAAMGIALGSLAACDHQQQPQVVQAQPQVIEQAPQVVQAPPQIIQAAPQVVYAQTAYNNGAGDLAAGMLIGSALSGGNRTVVVHHYSPAPVIVQHTTVNRTYVQAAPRAVYSAPSASYASRAPSSSSGLRRR